jgi:hypothetical protein
VIADRDRPGYEHAGQVATELRAAGCAVRVVRTPLEVEHGDVSDHLAAGLALADLEELPPGQAGETPALDPDEEPATADGEAAAEGEPAPVSDLDERRIEKATGEKKAKLSQARRLLSYRARVRGLHGRCGAGSGRSVASWRRGSMSAPARLSGTTPRRTCCGCYRVWPSAPIRSRCRLGWPATATRW